MVNCENYMEEVRRLMADTTCGIRVRYRALYRAMNEAMTEQTRKVDISFSGPFAKMDFLCREHAFEKHYKQLNHFRSRGRNLEDWTDEQLESIWLHDVRIVCDFICCIFDCNVPADLDEALPREYALWPGRSRSSCLRVIVEDWDERFMLVHTAERSDEETAGNGAVELRVEYARENFFGDWTYIGTMLQKGTQLNLVRPSCKDGVWTAELLIFEPDYLVDISAIAACFETYAHSPLVHLLNKLKPNVPTSAILLGNFAGQMLDEEIKAATMPGTGGNIGVTPPTYAESVHRFFSRHALEIAACPDIDERFHTEARRQQQTLRRLVNKTFRDDRTIRLESILLEPSFVCEMLGVQGRMDVLQDDFRVLMEQKSGKRDEFRHAHQEKHYVQMLLYLALLHYNYGIENRDISTYLLYSRYADGLLREGPAPLLLGEALSVRAGIVRQELLAAEGEGARCLDTLEPEDLKLRSVSDKFWNVWIKPQLLTLLEPLHRATDVERAYFHRFFTFLSREQLLTKVGNKTKEASGFAATWNATLEEKKEAGNIYERLELIALHREDSESGVIDEIVLKATLHDDTLPNFRTGDAVMVYHYAPDTTPDARSGMVMRAAIHKIESDRITLRLRAPQSNERIFSHATNCWAMEHDLIEASFGTLYRGLYAFIAIPDSRRRDLLLGKAKMRRDTSLTLCADYGTMNELVLRAKQASDFFLLVGPPGTGKTSCGLINILHETLCNPEASVLLAAYTNRAVEEICSKLVREGSDFLRIGNEAATAEEYRPHLLENRVTKCKGAKETVELLRKTRIVVGTTSSLSSNLALFTLKHFSLAIIDEASQILEPHLLPLLAADGGRAIERFVLIGDHKQLPAVVQQTETESRIDEPALLAAGLSDCRISLFERLLNSLPPDDPCTYHLVRQWRMHPAVADFPNRAFYEGRLQAAGAPHQLERMSRRPVVFYDVERPPFTLSDKVNEGEARVVAKLACDVVREYGFAFVPSDSIGIIVPYRNQIAAVRRQLEALGGEGHMLAASLTIDTVERFQGSERDVIIYSTTVRRRQQLDFLTSQTFTDHQGCLIDRKLNVALTRARRRTLIVGCAEVLKDDPVYAALLGYVQKNDSYFQTAKENYC